MDNKAIDERSGRKSRINEVTQISMTEQPNPKAQRVHSLLLAFVDSKGSIIVKNLDKHLKTYLLTMQKHALLRQIKN